MLKDYYKILGLPRTATSFEIKKRYHELARQFHPDARTNDAKLQKQRFLDITEAYSVLGDLDKRLKYSMQIFGLQYKDFEFSEEDIIEIQNITNTVLKTSTSK